MIRISVIVEVGRETFETELVAVPRKGDYLTFSRPGQPDRQREIKKVVWTTWDPERPTVYLR